MKLRLVSSFFLFALTTPAFASDTPIESDSPGKIYVGAFGGWGSSNHINANQYASAFFFEAVGGSLAVNGFGQINKHKTSFYGAQLGYQAQMICLFSQWTLGPAAELEGYSTSRSSFIGEFINDTARLPEHDFIVSYPMKRHVFLANAVLSFNNPCVCVHPYIGLGIGNAIVKISGASAAQISPPEAGVNHYNANTSDTVSTFAGQIKLGLSYDINKCISIFADYRWLYLANTHFLFGSTVYATHAETSSWQVNLDPQRYNLGNVGVRLNW